jgi:hypothetical protein
MNQTASKFAAGAFLLIMLALVMAQCAAFGGPATRKLYSGNLPADQIAVVEITDPLIHVAEIAQAGGKSWKLSDPWLGSPGEGFIIKLEPGQYRARVWYENVDVSRARAPSEYTYTHGATSPVTLNFKADPGKTYQIYAEPDPQHSGMYFRVKEK